jgi:hypothetical protein
MSLLFVGEWKPPKPDAKSLEVDPTGAVKLTHPFGQRQIEPIIVEER